MCRSILQGERTRRVRQKRQEYASNTPLLAQPQVRDRVDQMWKKTNRSLPRKRKINIPLMREMRERKNNGANLRRSSPDAAGSKKNPAALQVFHRETEGLKDTAWVRSEGASVGARGRKDAGQEEVRRARK